MEPMDYLILDYEADKLNEERKPIWIREAEQRFINKYNKPRAKIRTPQVR